MGHYRAAREGGGALAALERGDGMRAIEKIRAAYKELTGRKPAVLYEGNIIGAPGTAWLIEAQSLVESTLGASHATTRANAGLYRVPPR